MQNKSNNLIQSVDVAYMDEDQAAAGQGADLMLSNEYDEMLHLNDLNDENMAGEDDLDEAHNQQQNANINNNDQMLNLDEGEEEADRL
jgi:hypothetical protein